MPFLLTGPSFVVVRTMKFAVFLLLLCLACSNPARVTLTGPSVSDQLKSRGYIETQADTTAPDTIDIPPDTLKK